jgi:hypothetical protein
VLLLEGVYFVVICLKSTQKYLNILEHTRKYFQVTRVYLKIFSSYPKILEHIRLYHL